MPLALQLNNLLRLYKMMNKDSICTQQPETVQEKGRNTDISMFDKKRTEKTRGEFVIKSCRLMSRMDKYDEFEKKARLKNRIIAITQLFVRKNYS